MKRNAAAIAGIVGIAIVATSGVAMAGPGGKRAMHAPKFTFEQVDANADGMITAEELTAHAENTFKAADTDGNGSLSAEELQARVKNQAQKQMNERAAKNADRIIARHDDNGDGELSMAEMPHKASTRFIERVDADGDGAVSKDEYAKMLERVGERGDRQGWGKKGHGQKG